MSCPNQSSTVTIPLTGIATITPVDSTTCNPLDPTQYTGTKSVPGSPAVTLNATSQPTMTTDAAGIHLSANGLAMGASVTLVFTYGPNGKSFSMTAVVGGPVTPVGTTTTP